MTERDLERWSSEVARDPGAPAFVHLARAYRRQGRAAAAREVVLGGLAANPEHVEGHSLLALMHVEEGEREQARDEWETVQRLDPGHFGANRGLGFLALERGDLEAARRHLETAAEARAGDPAVSQALQVLERRESGPRPAHAARRTAAAAPPRPTPEPDTGRSSGAAVGGWNPVRLFAPLARETPFRGALVVDDQGLVLAGRLEEEDRQGDLLAALLNTAVSEAHRTVDVLDLASWSGVLLETDQAVLQLSRLEDDAVLVVVADREAPAGWVARMAGRARRMANEFLGGSRE